MKRLIRLPEVQSATGLSRSEIYRREGVGQFPKRVPLSKFATAWDADEIEAWVKQQIDNRDVALAKRKKVGRRLLSARMAA